MALVRISYINNKLRISRDPIIIFLGEKIEWILDTDPIVVKSAQSRMMKPVNNLGLTIYFPSFFPFAKSRYTGISKTGFIGNEHRIVIDTEPAKILGVFKYGIRLTDEDNGEEIEDEDPIIIVK